MEMVFMNESLPVPASVGFDYLELWVSDLGDARAAFTTRFGFEHFEAEVESLEDQEIASLICGDARLILRQGAATARYVAEHGDSIVDVALVCDDVASVAHRSHTHGLKMTYESGCLRIDVLGDASILHSLRDRRQVRHPVTHATSVPTQVKGIDHVTYCLPCGTMDRVARIYREVLGLASVRVDNCDEVGDNSRGMRTVVLRSPLGFAVVLTEPVSPESDGQTQRFLDAHGGAGVQHVAFAFDDLVAAAEALRSRGLAFLPIPREQLERSHQRLHDRALQWDMLQRNEILVDDEEDGLLFQLFTLPITKRSNFFIELIQRAGAAGFGANNVHALFAAVDAAIHDPAKMLWSRPEDTPEFEATAWIAELVESVRARIPFYRDHLAGSNSSSLTLLPTFDKSMTHEYGRFPLSAGGAHGAPRVVATSGTSGDRLFISFDQNEWNRTANWLEMVARRVGVTRDDVLLNTHCYGLWVGGPALDFLAIRSGAGLVPLGPAAPSTVLQLLSDGVGTAISATPSYLRRLIETAHASGFDLSRTALRFGFIGAEAAEPSLRSKLLSQLPKGFKWIELYGLTETGGPALAFAPDPTIPELEVNTQDFWVEVLDETADRPVKIGDVGELTITTRRTNGRTPLVRYRTRDLVCATAGNASAPTRISRILGRRDDSLKIGGVLVYPSAVAEIMSQFMPATAEWRAQIIRREPDDQLLVEAEASPDLCRAVKTAFQERVGVSLTVTSIEANTLARSRDKTQRILIDSSTAGASDPRSLQMSAEGSS
jgi:4-hydroxyphenylpyruvate dioxygenase